MRCARSAESASTSESSRWVVRNSITTLRRSVGAALLEDPGWIATVDHLAHLRRKVFVDPVQALAGLDDVLANQPLLVVEQPQLSIPEESPHFCRSKSPHPGVAMGSVVSR